MAKVNLTVPVNSDRMMYSFGVSMLGKVAEIIEPINDPEQIKGVIAVIRDGLVELAKSEGEDND